jgi:hypothetical protein
MIRKFWLLTISSILLSLASFSQTIDFSPWITKVEIDSNTVEILRVPAERFPRFTPDIISIQRTLEENRKKYSGGINTYGSSVESSCLFIENQDPTFPVRYYRAELKAYLDWNPKNEERLDRLLMEKVARQKDSIRIEKLKAGYSWINSDTVWVKAIPDLKGAAVGRLYRLNYVEAYVVEGKPDWMHIFFGDHSGYIYKKDIATKWEDMHLANEELEKLKSGRYFSFDPSAAYKAQLAQEAAAAQRASSGGGRKYYLGPQGGCYFINSHGKKEYVARSYCK